MTALPRSLPLVALVLAVAVLVLNAPLLAGGKTWSDRRYHTEVAPPRLAAADAVQHGALPTWWEGTGLGVPLAAEPSHGALYPPTWIAGSERSLDWITIAHFLWAALGIALWARRGGISRDISRGTSGTTGANAAATSGASEPAAVVAALLAVASGLFASAAVRGALPAISHLPWIGFASVALADANDRTTRVRATIGLALALGLCGLAGQFSALIDGLVIVLALARGVISRGAHGARGRDIDAGSAAGARDIDVGRAGGSRGRDIEGRDGVGGARGARGRDVDSAVGGRYFFIAVGAGLAIACAQWLPAFLASGQAGATMHAMPLGRMVELIVPGCFGGDGERAVSAIAGTHAWAPSVFVGAPLLALAAVRVPSRRVLVAIGALVAFALGVGRGGWPAWIGAPEVHVAALVVVLAVNAASGLDDLVAGKRRAIASFAAGAACAAIALGAIGVLRMRSPSDAIDRALIDGGIALVCVAIALYLAWREVAQPVILALLLLSSAGSVPSTHPTTARFDMPPLAVAAQTQREPRRVFRPVYMLGGPQERPGRTESDESLDEAIETLVGASPALWGLGAARSEDPARLAIHDETWLAAAKEGGALLDRFGIELALLPETVTASQTKIAVLATRGAWKLAKLPVAPPAAVMRGAMWSADVKNALDLMYPAAGGAGVLRGTVVLAGRGPAELDRGDPVACSIDRWDPGAIDLACDGPGYAAVSSTTDAGWSATVDDLETPWLTADIMRRAVPIGDGTHRIAWRYTAPGMKLGLGLAALALLGLLALGLASRTTKR